MLYVFSKHVTIFFEIMFPSGVCRGRKGTRDSKSAKRARCLERVREFLRTIPFTHQCNSALASTKARHFCNCSVTPRYIETIEQILPRAQGALDCISPGAVAAAAVCRRRRRQKPREVAGGSSWRASTGTGTTETQFKIIISRPGT